MTATKTNKTLELFNNYGMQSVSPVLTVEQPSATFKLGGIGLHPEHICWVANAIADRFSSSGMFPGGVTTQAIEEHLLSFYQSYLPSVPAELRDKHGSTSVAGLLCNWLIMSVVKPECYLESGVFVGASLRMADVLLPDAEKWAFDLSFAPLLHKSDDINFVQNDLSAEPPRLKAGQPKLAFFDDHIDPVRRIKECHALGVEWIIFDDSPIIPNIKSYRYPAVPSVAMIMDETIPDGLFVEWVHPSEEKTLRYTHDKEYCRAAKDLVAAHIDLRSCFASVGIHCGDKAAVRLKS